MKLPYHARLVLLVNNEWIEFARFHRRMFSVEINAITRGLSNPWRIERPLPDRACLSSRPVLCDPAKPGGKQIRLRLEHDEIANLEERGLQPEYKTA